MKRADAQRESQASTSRSNQPFFGAKSEAFFSPEGQRESFFQPSESVPVVQTKLTVGAVGDRYEQEADQVAAAVVDRIHAPVVSGTEGTAVQRMGKEEDELQMQPIEPVQRAVMAEDDGLQRMPTIQPMEADGGAVSANLEEEIHHARGGGQRLAPELQTQMGQAMGADFSGVRVHTDARSDQLNRAFNSRSFTTRQDVFFRQGEYQPGSRGGQELIAHELTHVVQQNAGSGSSTLVQAKLMTSQELSLLTGVSRRTALARGFKALGGVIHIGKGGSSYDSILGLLEGYENLSESDPQGTQKAKRLAILTDLEKRIFDWYGSSSRQRDASGEVVGSSEGENQKIKILQELMYEVVGERDAIAAMSDSIESGIKQTKEITTASTMPPAPSPAETQAQVVQQQQKSFWSAAGEKISTAWHRTFGLEFYPTQVVPLHTDFLSEYDIRRSVELIEVAMEVERNLIADGVEPLKAVALAYQYLPSQLRPLSPAPEEKVVLKVKLQIFRESLAQKEAEKASKLDQTKEVLDKADSVSSKSGTGVEALEKISIITPEVVESYASVNDLVGSVIGVVSSFVDIFKLLDRSTDPKISKTEQSQNEVKAGVGAIAILEKLISLGDQINSLVAGASATPILGILSSVFSIVQSLIKGARLLVRYYQEGKLNKSDEAQSSGLLGALVRTARRGRNLAISAGTEIIISALEIASAILGPSGIAGGVVAGLTSIIKYGKKAVEQLESSYTAGLAQEAQLEAESGVSGSAKKVLESSDKWGLTAIILEAKDGNAIAIQKLELYGIHQDDIQSMDVTEIRQIIMEELEREENAETLSQKTVGKLLGKGVKG